MSPQPDNGPGRKRRTPASGETGEGDNLQAPAEYQASAPGQGGIATDAEIRANVRENLLSLREDVVALGYRWEHATKFLAVIDALISDCDNPALDAVELACLHVKPMSFQQAIRAGDDERRPL